MPHIFISYSTTDTRQLALNIRSSLEQLSGITAWMDESLVPGEYWSAEIEREIDRCDCMVVLLSRDVNRPSTSPNGPSFVLKEILHAQSAHKPVIPVRAASDGRMPILLQGIQYIDFTHDQMLGMQKLLQDIAKRTGIPVPKLVPSAAQPPSPQPTRPVYRRLLSSRYTVMGIGILSFAVVVIAVLSSLNNSARATETPAPTAVSTQIAAQPTDVATFAPQVDAPATNDTKLTSIAKSWTPSSPATPDHFIVRVRNSSTIVRTGPGKEYSVLAILSKDQQLDVIGKTLDGWYKVEYLVGDQTIAAWINYTAVTEVGGDAGTVPTISSPPTLPPRNAVTICNPGEWNPICGSNGCSEDSVSQCNTAGTEYTCVWSPSNCSGSSTTSSPTPGDFVYGALGARQICSQSWLDAQIVLYGASLNPPLSLTNMKEQLIAKGFDMDHEGDIDCDDYNAAQGT